MESRGISKAGMWAVLLAFSLTSCGGSDSSGSVPAMTTATRGDVVASTQKGVIGLVAIDTLMVAIDTKSVVKLSTAAPDYPVTAYAITYRTVNPSGNLVPASGLLLVPQKPAGSSGPLLSLQHGTARLASEAPSELDLEFPDTVAGIILASLGYEVAMPDYLGYGVSQNIFHPYLQASTLTSSTLDMLRASRIVLQQLGVATNGQLFLTGYSEGGYATLAVQREMETTLASEFTVTASEPASGPYDLSGTVATVMQKPDLAGVTDPAILAFLLRSYHTYYGEPARLGDAFTPGTVLDCVQSDFGAGYYGIDPTTGIDFNSCIGNLTATTSILNPSFVSDYNGSGQTALKAALAANDDYDWRPSVPTRLFYSTGDDVVPPANATTALTTMTANGSTTVTTATCTGATSHADCVVPYFNDVIAFFATLATDR